MHFKCISTYGTHTGVEQIGGNTSEPVMDDQDTCANHEQLAQSCWHDNQTTASLDDQYNQAVCGTDLNLVFHVFCDDELRQKMSQQLWTHENCLQ